MFNLINNKGKENQNYMRYHKNNYYFKRVKLTNNDEGVEKLRLYKSPINGYFNRGKVSSEDELI